MENHPEYLPFFVNFQKSSPKNIAELSNESSKIGSSATFRKFRSKNSGSLHSHTSAFY